MALALIIAVISLPILELLVLIKIGGTIGILPLLLLLVGMAIAGGLVLRHQGLALARQAMDQLARNEPPVQSMIDGIGLTLAGVLFLIPGLISDIIGLLLLVPALRRPLIGRLIGAATIRWDGRKQSKGSATSPDAAGQERAEAPRGGVVIDGEFERLEERTLRPGRGTSPNGQEPKDDSPWRK
jgi:UPF0716 protein FxsA